ncbi:hypothetical protein EIP86_000089 [Pleurotus ostreatoroseus]|nr:hypothetical protein EIP86_000089 [Pleurotus ostreatoroseus]
MTVVFPPLDGSITVLPGFLDFHAEHNRDRPFALFPSISGTGVTSVLFAELAETTHMIAHILRPNREGADGEVVGVLIHCDVLLYVATLLGIIRAGLVPLPISPRNSSAAIANLLEQTSAHRLISQASLSSLTKATQEELLIKGHPLFITPLPSLSEVFPNLFPQKTHHTPVVPYPNAKNPRTQDEVVLYLHSSGSTGFPRAIPQTGVNILDWSNTLYAPLVTGFPIGLYTPQAPLSPVVPTPENVLEVSKKLGCNAIPAVPAFLEIWAQSEKDMEYLASQSYVV